MTNRIDTRFSDLKAAGRPGLITFVTAGDPDPTLTVDVLHALADTDSVLELRPGFGLGMITALARIAEHGHGVMVLLYHPQGGQELLAQLNGDGAAARPGQKWDPRLFGIGAQILRELHVGKMRIMASPRKIPSMAGFGLTVVGHLAAEA